MEDKTNVRSRILETITMPLGFFVLALLIVELFLGTLLIKGGVNPDDIMTCIYLGVAMFILVVLIVAVLVWNKPQHLSYDKDAHLKIAELNSEFNNEMKRFNEELKKQKDLQEALNEATFCIVNKRYMEANEAYQKALDLNPASNYAKIGVALSKSYLNPDDFTEPIKLLNEVIERDPINRRALYNRACLKALKPDIWPKKA